MAKHQLLAWPACATSEAARVWLCGRANAKHAPDARIWHDHDGRFSRKRRETSCARGTKAEVRCDMLRCAVNNGDPRRVAVEKQTRSWRCFPGAGEHSMFGEIAKSRTDQHSPSQPKARVGAVQLHHALRLCRRVEGYLGTTVRWCLVPTDPVVQLMKTSQAVERVRQMRGRVLGVLGGRLL